MSNQLMDLFDEAYDKNKLYTDTRLYTDDEDEDWENHIYTSKDDEILKQLKENDKESAYRMFHEMIIQRARYLQRELSNDKLNKNNRINYECELIERKQQIYNDIDSELYIEGSCRGAIKHFPGKRDLNKVKETITRMDSLYFNERLITDDDFDSIIDRLVSLEIWHMGLKKDSFKDSPYIPTEEFKDVIRFFVNDYNSYFTDSSEDENNIIVSVIENEFNKWKPSIGWDKSKLLLD